LVADYYKVADSVSVEQYVQDEVAGRRFDANLSKQLRKGFQVHGLIPNYTVDERSLHWGVEIVWANPDYQPRRFWRVNTPHLGVLNPRHPVPQPAQRSA
jgi:hypothetical protein